MGVGHELGGLCCEMAGRDKEELDYEGEPRQVFEAPGGHDRYFSNSENSTAYGGSRRICCLTGLPSNQFGQTQRGWLAARVHVHEGAVWLSGYVNTVNSSVL